MCPEKAEHPQSKGERRVKLGLKLITKIVIFVIGGYFILYW